MPPFFLLAALLFSPAQQAVPDPRAAAATQDAGHIREAEDLLERGNYQAAEPVLSALANTHPHDARILFDLGFTQEHNGNDSAAQASYTASMAADPTLVEPEVASGLLLARTGHDAEGRALLQKAAGDAAASPGLRGRALRALARLDQTTQPDQARAELAQAVQLTGAQSGDAELTASLTAGSGTTTEEAIALERKALEENPGDIAAMSALASLLTKQQKLAEADSLLTSALAAHPEDPRLVAQAAAVDAAEGKQTEAIALLKNLRSSSPDAAANPDLTRLYAHLLLVSGDAEAAEPLYRSLVDTNPADPLLLDELGSALVREQKFAEAQTVLSRAVSQRQAFHDDAAWAETAGHLAFAASRNHQPELVLQALHARATVLPNSPATLFLEATALDTLRRRKEAEQAYRAFLAVANGKLPDEEFEARHRLIALEHER